jgi:hypothetical protein
MNADVVSLAARSDVPGLAGHAGETGDKERNRGLIGAIGRVHLDTSAFICVHLWFQEIPWMLGSSGLWLRLCGTVAL